jgi:hypothetical protein
MRFRVVSLYILLHLILRLHGHHGQQTRSGAPFSPWEMSKAIASSIKDFAFDTLLMGAILAEKENDGEGTEGDASDGTGFEAVHDPSAPSTAPPHTASPRAPTLSPPSTSIPPTGTKRRFDSISNSEPPSDDDTSSRKPNKKKSKSKIEYKKLAFKKRRAADRQGAKSDIEVKVRPSLLERHTASSTPVSVPSFSLDAKTAAKSGYVGIRDSKASKRVYRLGEIVGEGSKFKFNLLEWDGK